MNLKKTFALFILVICPPILVISCGDGMEKIAISGWLTSAQVSEDGETATFQLRHAYYDDEYAENLKMENVLIQCPVVVQRHLVRMVLIRDLSNRLILKKMKDRGDGTGGNGVFGCWGI